MVRYSARTSIMRPASSSSTFTPAIASWNAAIPPAAPLPTTMTSHCADPGVIDAASLRGSCVIGSRFSASVESGCMSPLLPAMRAILAVFGRAADEVLQELIALVAQLAMDADFRRVIAADGRLLGHDEKLLQRRGRFELVLTDGGENRIELPGVELGEGAAESRYRVLVERCQSTHPLQSNFGVAFAQQEVDVVGDPCFFGTRGSLVGGNDRFDQHLERGEIRCGQHLWRGSGSPGLNPGKGKQSVVRERGQQGSGGSQRLQCRTTRDLRHARILLHRRAGVKRSESRLFCKNLFVIDGRLPRRHGDTEPA